MSLDKNRQCVRSKYFVGKTVMDESLSDFQETKPSCKGPKTSTSVAKTKTKKLPKRIRGQKDIRTALRGKKNELVAYTKEFDNICKKSGIDVDSEQLQVAVALSKSLQPEDLAFTSQSITSQGRAIKIRATLQEYGFKVPESKVTSINKKIKRRKQQYKLLHTTKEERDQKVRNKYSQILLETLNYKSGVSINHSSKLYSIATNLEYKFMKDNNVFYVDSLSNLEKSINTGCLLRNWSEIPGRPVSPVLFDKNAMDFSEILCSQDELDIILSGPIKSAYKIIGTKKEKINNLNCDIPNVANEVNEALTDVINEQVKADGDKITTVNTEYSIETRVLKSSVVEITKCKEVGDIVSKNILPVGEQHRSCSPDIFDDEVSYTMEKSNPTLSQEQNTKIFTNDTNTMDITECANNFHIEKVDFMSLNTTKIQCDDFMEITECAVSASQGIKVNIKEIDLTQSPEEIYTREKPCDANKGTNHIPESSDYGKNEKQKHVTFQENDNELIQKITEENYKSINNISLTNNTTSFSASKLFQNSITKHNVKTMQDVDGEKHSDNIDFTQSSKEDDNTLITNIQQDNAVLNKEIESVDLTQSSKSSVDINELPEIFVGNTQNDQNKLDDTVIINEEEYIGINDKFKKTVINKDEEIFDLTQATEDLQEQPNDLEEEKNEQEYSGNLKKATVNQDEQIFDLTQATEDFQEQSNDFEKEKNSTQPSQSFYEDFVHDHSDNSGEQCKHNISDHNTSNACDDINLTQTSDRSTETGFSPKPLSSIETIPNNSSLGKKDNISIDYDEICEYVVDTDNIEDDNCNVDEDSSNFTKNNSSKYQTNSDIEIVGNNNDLISSSQSSEVFDLTDKELDYSLYKSRLDIQAKNDKCKETSVEEGKAGCGSYKKSLTHSVINNNSLEETFLPQVNLKKPEKSAEAEDQCDASSSSSHKVHNINRCSNTVPVTPRNNEYIIKTDDVTPILDYASLTTPQRNKELDKYGLKPFKRKRAIQILTHLYNQTHPVIEPYLDDQQPSPSKKLRQEPMPSSEISPNELKTAEKINVNNKSPKNDSSKRNSQSPREHVNSPQKKLNSRETINGYEITSDVPNIRSVECNPDDWVFQKREKAKVQSCRVPLHIAFHNYVSSRQGLREAILKYEPVNIDVIHKELVSYGHRYDPKDLLRFLDKKCITVKTTDNNARNRR